MTRDIYHEPVMVREALEGLHIKKFGKYIDATVGTGGHTEEIVKGGGDILGIDLDPLMLEAAEMRLKEACPTSNQKGLGSYRFIRGNFKDIDKIAKENGFEKADGILFDLGVSNIHLTSKTRGFSFGNQDAPLDMRLSPDIQGVTGADLLNVLREDQLKELFSVAMEGGSAGWLAKKVVAVRNFSPIKTVGDFLAITDKLRRKPGLNPSTLPFLALRIAVNSELENLTLALPKAFDLLNVKGRLVVISFHSGEDRIVKEFALSKEKEAKVLTDKPIMAGSEEIERNPRARSAKMRVLEKN